MPQRLRATIDRAPPILRTPTAWLTSKPPPKTHGTNPCTKQVDWSEERTCFEGVAAELALYYSTLPIAQDGEGQDEPLSSPSTALSSQTSVAAIDTRKGGVSGQGPAAGAGAGAASADRGELGLAPAEATAVVQHVMYPAFRRVALLYP